MNFVDTRRLWLLTILLAVATTAPISAPLSAQGAASTVSARAGRMSDATVQSDLATFALWQQELRSARAANAALPAYPFEKAERWLALAQDAYEGNSPDPVANSALATAAQLITQLASGKLPALDEGTAVPAPGRRVRPELWHLADSLRALRSLSRSGTEVAALEASLIRAGLVAAGALTCERESPDRAADRAAVRALALSAEEPAVVAVVPPKVDTVVIATPAPAPAPAPVPPPAVVTAAPKLLTGVPRNVHFALNADTLSRGSRIVLDAVADSLKKYVSVAITLFGNTDSRGSAEYNLALSRRRADAVRGYLIAKGLDGSRIRLEANGKLQLKTAEADVVDLARNRRVDIQYVTSDGTAIETKEGLNDLQVEARTRTPSKKELKAAKKEAKAAVKAAAKAP
jgi:outer membrane protein OmpA-like peptidoglycan-associated protein